MLCLAALAAVAQADVKIKSKSTSAGQSSEHVVYIKGKRQRTELNPALVSIMQCDLRRTIDLSDATKTYVVSPFDQKTEATAQNMSQPTAQTPTTSARRGGIVTTTISATDTGERKQMFGYTARRIKTTMVTESSPEACEQTRSRMETDGWYIDAAFALDCADKNASATYVARPRPDGCRDDYRMKQTGTARTGYPVLLTTTMFDENGKASFTWSQEVLEISKAVLDDALFDVPAGYREVKDRQEMYSAAAMMSANARSNATNDDDDNDATAANDGDTRPGGSINANVRQRAASQADASAATLGAKRAGVLRVGVVATRATAAGEGISASALADAVRHTLINHLKAPTIEVVALEAHVPQQAATEATQKECDLVLYSTVAHKKGGGGGFGGFLRKAAPIVDIVPTGTGASSVAADVAVRTTIYTAADFAASIKAKDELTLEYKLQRANDSTQVAAQTLKAKAKSDGDDLISQLVEQATAAILNAATQ
jgi:hypothetical protein